MSDDAKTAAVVPNPSYQQRATRFVLCHAAEQFHRGIQAIEGDAGAKVELANLVTIALRMSLRLSEEDIPISEHIRAF